jgi:hypothetical protein
MSCDEVVDHHYFGLFLIMPQHQSQAAIIPTGPLKGVAWNLSLYLAGRASGTGEMTKTETGQG